MRNEFGFCGQRHGASFSAGCSLIQREQDGFIITGPIVLESSFGNLVVLAEPELGEVIFLDEYGDEIDLPRAGETFYIAVPSTKTSYLVRLYAVRDISPSPVERTEEERQETLRRNARAGALDEMANHAFAGSGVQKTPWLPPWIRVYASLNFYINPKPCNPPKPCCVTMPGGAKNDRQEGMRVPCCLCDRN